MCRAKWKYAMCFFLIVVLVSCAQNANDFQKGNANPQITRTEHELELVSSVWGFGTANNQVMSADTGFFCISRDDRGIYPIWYDPETMEKKSLGTDKLLSYFESYQVFTAGDRLVACAEENSRINIIRFPYEEVSFSYLLHDKEGKVWHIYYQSAIVYDRTNDLIYCTLSENEMLRDPAVRASVDLNTGLVTLLRSCDPQERTVLFACNSTNNLILMVGTSSNQKQHGETPLIIFDLQKHEKYLSYSGEKLSVEKDPYCGYAFGDDGIYFTNAGSLQKYSYKDGSVCELCQLSDRLSIPSQVLAEGKLHFSVPMTSDYSPTVSMWYDTGSGELFDFRFSRDGIKRSGPTNKGLYGECGNWYCLVEYGESSSISDNRYVLVDKRQYWTGDAEIIHFDD